MTKKQSGQNAYKSFGVLSVDILTYHPLLSLDWIGLDLLAGIVSPRL